MQLANQSAGDLVTAANVDLSNCDRELIHMPGLSQPHGVMLVLRPGDLAIVQASENAAALSAHGAQPPAGSALADLLGPTQAAAMAEAVAHAGDRLDRGPLHLLQVPPSAHHETLDAIAHRAGAVLILELERVSASQGQRLESGTELADFMDDLHGTTSLPDFLNLAMHQVHALSGFDRVMAYRFAADGSGEVVAEAKRNDLTAYRGLHFPASDIPAPARRLFAMSWLRHLPDVDYVPLRLLPAPANPVDMSRATLRHVSVMYSSYLKNMGVHATLVMPLMKAGELWGLISCMHHASPLHVPCASRTALELLAHMVSSLMADREARDTAAYRERMSRAVAALDDQMARQADYQRGLCGGEVTLHGWLDASGAALVTPDGIVRFGETPTETEIGEIVAWMNSQDDGATVWQTDRLSQLYPAAAAFRGAVSGLLVARMMRNRPELVMWFRRELVHTVNWAGDPRKPVQVDVLDGEARLTPRKSFELWQQEVRGRSSPWLAWEIEAVRSLRQAITEKMLIRLNRDLQRSNAELDNFAYVASHDLKEPLRGIANFAQFLQRSADAKLTPEERGRIETIIRLARRMDDLTDALMQYSRVGRADFALEQVDLNELLHTTLDLLAPRIGETGTVVRVAPHLPTVLTDRLQLIEVLSNLIVNALKYNVHPAGERWIEIGMRDHGAPAAFYVRDNGIGIAARHLEQVFQIFRRLHGRDEYGGGNGAGLTIARRTVERLGGRLWAESDGLGKGATFLFTLNEGAKAGAGA